MSKQAAEVDTGLDHKPPSIVPVLRRPMVSAALAIVAGLVWWLAAPPRGWWVLFPLGVAGLTVAVYGRSLRARAVLGALCGVALYVPSLYWLTDFSGPGYVAAALFQVGLLAATTAAVPALLRGPSSSTWAGGWWTLPAALVLLEAVQTRVPFGGFPLPALVLSQPDGPFMSAAPLGGSLAVTATAATSGVALAALILVSGRRRIMIAGAAIVVAAAPVLVGTAIATEPAGTIDATVVQGGGPRGLRAIETDSSLATERHLAAAKKIDDSPDLVLLPENVVHVDGPIADTALDGRLAALAQSLDTNLVVGVIEGDGDRFRNAAVLWGPDGSRLDRYEKEHRVPFGEYIPARGLFERLSENTRFVPRDAVIGEGEAMFDSPAGPLGVVISFEVFFADRVAEGVRAGGEIVLVPTDASSYVTEDVPALELAAARLRAHEFGRTVLQAAPTGYSAVVLPSGEVAARSELGDEALLRETVPLRTGMTPYARFGDVPLVAIAAATLVLAPVARAGAARRRSSRG